MAASTTRYAVTAKDVHGELSDVVTGYKTEQVALDVKRIWENMGALGVEVLEYNAGSWFHGTRKVETCAKKMN